MLKRLIKVKMLSVAALIISLPSYALQVKTATDNEPIKAAISVHELTRISIDGDKIASVAGISDSYLLQNDELQGAIFIKPTEKVSGQKTFSIFLATQGGHNYILQLTPQKIAAETIILKPKLTKPKLTDANWASASTDQQTITKLLSAMIKREFKKEYLITYLDRSKKQFFKHNDAYLSLIAEYRGNNLLGQIYQVENKNRKGMVLSEEQFYWRGVKGVALQNHILPAHRSGFVYVVMQQVAREV